MVGLNVDGNSGDENLEREMAKIFRETFELWKLKQKHYSSDNIAEQGIAGIYGKMVDKKARFKQYLMESSELPDETIEDTWKDMINYAAMCIALNRNLWPEYDGENYQLVKIE